MCMKQTCKTCRKLSPFLGVLDRQKGRRGKSPWLSPTLSYLPSCYVHSDYLFTEKTTWWGCGQHIPRVMDSVPQSDWCTCNPKTTVNSKEYPPKNGKGKASSTGDYGSTPAQGSVAKLTGQDHKPDTC